LQIDFGTYAGKTLEEIAEVEPGYLRWLIREQVGPAELRAEAARVLEQRGALGRPADRPRRPAWLWSVFGGLVVVAAMVLIGLFSALTAPPAPVSPTAELTSLTTADHGPPTAGTTAAVGGPPSAVVPTFTYPPPSPIAVQQQESTPTPTSVGLTPTLRSCGSRVAGAIRADQVRDYLDQYQTVEFQVVRSHNSGRAVFLNSHDPYQGYFEVVIFPERWPDFPEPPEKYFDGKCVVVRGRIQLYRGTPEIVLRSADDIRVVD
jgi:hypothetical protein